MNLLTPYGTTNEVVNKISRSYGVTPKDVKGKSRKQIYCRPRQLCMYFLKFKCDLTLDVIGHILGGRDHTTVMNGIQKVEDQKRLYSDYNQTVNELINKI